MATPWVDGTASVRFARARDLLDKGWLTGKNHGKL
jgi:hypothetical protein